MGMAAPGVRGQDAREKWKNIVGARCSERGLAQEMKEESFFIGIQRERLGGKVRPGEARFGPELDGEKAVAAPGVRGQDAREKWKTNVPKI